MMYIKNKLNKSTGYFITFSIVFAFTAFIVFFPFLSEGKSFLWKSDGTDQHYTAMVYYWHYLRDIKKTFTETGKIVLPMWDFKIGQGSDIITTLNYYCIGDPLTLLSMFFSEQKLEYCYDLLVIVRIYLSGLSFSAYCFYMRQSKLQAFTGAFVYMFCGYTMVALKHPFFINPMIYLPLLLIGIEKILRKESPLIFIGMVFLSAVSNFYFLFILSIHVFIYASIRYFFMDGTEKNVRGFLISAAKGIISYGFGIAMSSAIFMPILYAMRQTARYGERGSGLIYIYPLEYYFKLLTSFFYKPIGNYWSCLGFPATAVLPITYMFFIKDSKVKQLKIAFIIAICFLLLPEGGYLFNAFAYVTNRWVFGFSFCVALTFSIMLPYIKTDIPKAVFKRCFLLCLCLLIVNILMFLFGYNNDYKGSLFLITVILLLFLWNRNRNFICLFLGLTIFCICINSNLFFNRNAGRIISQYSYKNQYMKKLFHSPLKLINNIKDSSFFRIDTYRWSFVKKGERKEVSDNKAMLLNYKGISVYFSLINPNYADYIKELGVIGILSPYRIYSLDNRTVLNELASVKYSLLEGEASINVPYGYNLLKHINLDNRSFGLYKNKFALPLGYTYSQYIKMKDYRQLSILDKQQIMLDHVVLEQDAEINESKQQLYSSQAIEVKFSRYKSKEIKPRYRNAYGKKIYSLRTVPNSEVYLVMKNVGFNPETRFNLVAETSSTIKFAKLYHKSEAYYYGRKDVVINLGYFKKPIDYFMLYTDKEGKLSYDEMSIICIPMNNYSYKINKLKENTLQNLQVSVNSVNGSILLKEPKLLCLSIPYSTGWKAKVDGKAAQIYKANIMYMAIPLKAGNHRIQLDYCTPGLKAGTIISLTAIFLFILVRSFRGK